jgi:large subunit ribosomal protein L25
LYKDFKGGVFLELITLKANIRKASGGSSSRSLRRQGMVPAILYGPSTEPVWITVDKKELELTFKKGKIGQLLYDLVVHNGEIFTKSVMIKELQSDPLSRDFLHVDFYEISMDRKIKVNVPVITKGKCKGVEGGGILQIVRRELEVLCLPGSIPETIEIDITDLEVGDSVHVEEILMGNDIEISADVNFTVVTVVSPQVEETPAEEEDIDAEEGEVPEAESGESE